MIQFELGNFVRDLEAEATRTYVAVGDTIRDSIADLVGVIVDGTPVQSGLGKGSWRVGLGKSPKERGTPDPSGTISKELARAMMKAWKPGDDLYIGNTATNSQGDVYLYFVEVGTSKVRPRGFARSALAKFPAILQANAAKNAGKR
jgi:hypothetical protein